jgi:ATP-binding cassette subfamily B protein
MPLVEEMPDWLTADVETDDLLLAAQADLDLDGAFAEQWFLASRKKARVVVQDGERVEVRWESDLSLIEEVTASTRVGSGFLEVKSDGVKQSILRYSNARTKRFAQVAKSLTDFIKEGTEPKESEEEGNVCPECGIAFMEGTKVCPKCMSKWKAFIRIIRYARRHRTIALLITLLLACGTALRFAPPVIVREIVDKVLVSGAGQAVANPTGRLLLLVALLLATHAAGALLRITHGRLAAGVGAGMVFDLRSDAYRNLQQLSLSFYDKRQVGALMSRITHDTDHLLHFIVEGIQYIFMNMLTLILVTAIMFWHSPKLALLALVTAPAVMYCTRILIKKLITMFHRFFDYRSRFHALVNDVLSGIRVVKAFSKEGWEVDRFQARNERLRDAGVTVEKAFSTIFPSLHFLSTIGSVLVWLVGGYSVIAHDITIGTFFMFVYLLGMIQGPLEGLSRINHWISHSLAGAERVFEIIDAAPDVKEPKKPEEITDMKGDVSFNHVTFGYDKYKPVLKDFDLHVKAGEMIGFVGHSGAGKTTAANLICRFYDPNQGSVTVDGVDLRDFRRVDYGRKLGVVLQESFLFNGSILENIAYGKQGATPEEVMRAARVANAHGFIVDKPDGYDSPVGEGGKLLSVGEKQRISIARAILHDPRILILDEATASVDTDTEKQIQEALGRLVKGRTTFAIAHRLSTLRMSDRLVVIKEGEIEESGTHAELMKKKGEYHRLVKMQSDMSKVKTVGG